MRDVTDGLSSVESSFRLRGDRRAVFATAYALITNEIISRVGSGSFRNPPWVETYVVAFAELYRRALSDHLAGRLSSVPSAWRIAFDTSQAGEALVIQDLLLGINAHINHDLPLALEIAGLGGSLDEKYADHTDVNRALETTTGRVQDRIAAYYARGLGVLDDLLLFLDEEIAQMGFEESREQSWRRGRELVASGSSSARQAIVESLDRQSVTLAERILGPNGRMPWLIGLLGYLENRFPWPRWGAEKDAFADLAPADRLPNTMDELIEDLLELMTQMDAERDRLSVYVSTYLRNTRKVKSTIESGGFKDPNWMEALDVRFGAMYFAYIEGYRAGHTSGLPRCWRKALQEIALGETTVVQDAILQVIPRVVYDLPIALHAVGMASNIAARHGDYETTYDLFLLDLDEIQASMARKYSPMLRVMDIIGGPLDEWMTDHLYRKARADAWGDALRLQKATDDVARQDIIAELDQRAFEAIRSFANSDRPIARGTARLVRGLEDRFPGDWSGEV